MTTVVWLVTSIHGRPCSERTLKSWDLGFALLRDSIMSVIPANGYQPSLDLFIEEVLHFLHVMCIASSCGAKHLMSFGCEKSCDIERG